MVISYDESSNFKLSACGRHSSLFSLSFDFVCLICICFCFLGKVFAIQVWGSVLLHLPNLRHSSGIVFLDTLGTMCHFSLGVG
jgi:hypothetical protein